MVFSEAFDIDYLTLVLNLMLIYNILIGGHVTQEK